MEIKYNLLQDMFSPEEHFKYVETEYPFNIKLVRTALDNKLKEDPNYEVFVPFYYWKLSKRVKGVMGLSKPYKWFISNLGRVLSLRQPEPLIMTLGFNNSGYPQIVNSKNNESFVIHRAIGCSFIPITKPNHFHPKDLEVNHINGVKADFSLTNLEWLTTEENKQHAIDTGLIPTGDDIAIIIHLKATVIKGNFKGYQFILHGGGHAEEIGFDQPSVSKTFNGVVKSHRGCVFVEATEEDIKNLPRGPSEEVLKELNSFNPAALFITIGTCMKTGKVVKAIGHQEIAALGFSVSGVSNALLGYAKSSGGYVWTREPI